MRISQTLVLCVTLFATFVYGLRPPRGLGLLPFKAPSLPAFNMTFIPDGNLTEVVINGNTTVFGQPITTSVGNLTQVLLSVDSNITFTFIADGNTTIVVNETFNIPTTQTALVFPTGNGTLHKRLFEFHSQQTETAYSGPRIFPPQASATVRNSARRNGL